MPDRPTGSAAELPFEQSSAVKALNQALLAQKTASQTVNDLVLRHARDELNIVELARELSAVERKLREQVAVVRALSQQDARELDELRAALMALADQAAMLRALVEVPGVAVRTSHEQVVIMRAERGLDAAERVLFELDSWIQTLPDDKIVPVKAPLRSRAELAAAELAAKASNEQGDANAADSVSVSIYLADEGIHEQVEAAVEHWLATARVAIDTRDEPVIGSWFRRLTGSLKTTSKTPAGREALLTAVHVVDSRVVQSQDAYVTATLLQNVGPVLQALQPTKDAVVRAGALLIVKVEWVVQVHQLTAAQQAILDHRPQLATSPNEIITALQLIEPNEQEGAIPSMPQPVGHGESVTATGN